MSGTQPAHPTHDRRRQPLPQLGRRGAGWVAAQIVLVTAIFLSALVGLGWPSWLEPPAYAIGGVLVAAGVGMLAAGGGALARVSAVTPFPAPRTGSGLQTSGIYQIVRHPMYGGGILIALGWSMIFATLMGLILTIVLAVFADLKARREELWLEQTFAEYTAYRQHTRSTLIPFVW
jgi:protein-S-isoprenylcysteine O-methyltransferase Ste14